MTAFLQSIFGARADAAEIAASLSRQQVEWLREPPAMLSEAGQDDDLLGMFRMGLLRENWGDTVYRSPLGERVLKTVDARSQAGGVMQA